LDRTHCFRHAGLVYRGITHQPVASSVRNNDGASVGASDLNAIGGGDDADVSDIAAAAMSPASSTRVPRRYRRIDESPVF